ncbi:fimbrial protein [Serratia fonticola]|uniref:fimbrial protein n=1 Tax=Serratia fonticola TaxID=47917 RepID=UPI002176F610|nr:fimbrial protein [Serratia fonticola]CAI2039740.1 fimbrial protein [Serratia fonticola]
MKTSIHKLFGLLGGVVLSMTSTGSWAVVNCFFAPGAAQVETVPLSPPVISAGADIPVGTIIYQGSWLLRDVYMECHWEASDHNKSFWFSASTLIGNAPLPLSNLMTGPFAGAVYQTNIPGVGVAISRAAYGTPIVPSRPAVTTDIEVATMQSGSGGFNFTAARRYVSLIKTGTITPGNYSINGSSFPTIKTTVEPPVNSHIGAIPIASGVPFTVHNINFQGNLTVSTQTCTTPDVSVTLGTYDINKTFKGINSTTPWIDSSITLTNCPTFHGFYNNTNTTLLMDYKTGQSNVSQSLNNSIGVRLTPTSEVKDAANGVMAIDSTVSEAASGVGIQLGWGMSNQTPVPFNFSAEQSMALPKDGSTTIRVPLSARYIQTDARPTPGKANGKVVFLVNYY